MYCVLMIFMMHLLLIVAILVVGMYGTIYGTHRHRTPDTDTNDNDVLIFLSSRQADRSFAASAVFDWRAEGG